MQSISKYTFYIDGINKTRSAIADDEKSAHKAIWEGLSDSEKNCTACIDCIDEEPIAPQEAYHSTHNDT
jgi:hypothetical protein